MDGDVFRYSQVRLDQGGHPRVGRRQGPNNRDVVLGNHGGGKAVPRPEGLQVKGSAAIQLSAAAHHFCGLSAACRWRATESVASTACVLVSLGNAILHLTVLSSWVSR